MAQQQTVLRVLTNIPGSISGTTQYDFLDLYGDIPIKINKSFAELQDISKKNSDYSIGLLLPGSKKNNAFFESFFNVDNQSLYFNPTKRVPCEVLKTDQPYFRGFLKLNKVSVLDSKVEYDVTLYSTVANLFGNIGNNLLKDLNFGDTEYKINHEFNLSNVTLNFNVGNFSKDSEYPYPYIYPVVHNGYEYSGDTVNLSGGTVDNQTRLYTTTGPLDSYASPAAAYAAGVQEFRLNSPTQGILDNQLKPALNIWTLIQLMFKSYGYTIKSDFMNTPWMKTLYMYGYFSSDQTKFSYKVYEIQSLPIEGVEVIFFQSDSKVSAIVCKLGTGTPCFCDFDINVTFQYVTYLPGYDYYQDIDSTIIAGTSGVTQNVVGDAFTGGYSSQVPNGSSLAYFPVPINSTVTYSDGDYVDFSLVIDPNIKQIDLLSSIAKKFNLIFIPDNDIPNQVIIEPFDYYVGSGQIYDWTDKLSYDKGFTVEPALNYIESELILTDLEDGDYGNKIFKDKNSRIYGENRVYNPTDFKSQSKKIETIFGSEIIRKWDDNVSLPLGINYAESSQEQTSGNSTKIVHFYKGVKTKPKLMYYLGCFNPFIDILNENYNYSNFYKTYNAFVSNSDGSSYATFDRIPVISHTMPIGNPDENKIVNDNLSILFNSEQPTDIGVPTFNVYTENDAYSSFYSNRINNLYDPNTRYLGGFFDLKLPDVQNLQANDLIKVKEQYFTWDKIEAFNLTNLELTKVQLIQFNNFVRQYPDRYFQYYYCDNPSKVYKFKIDFTNPNLLHTNYGWSIYYDNQIGMLGNTPSGFTSTFRDIEDLYQFVYIPYTMYEVSEDDYNASGLDWSYDSLHNFIYSDPSNPFNNSMPTFWLNSDATRTGINTFSDCDNFNTVKNTWNIITGSSTYHGIIPTPTPTPSPTPTPTPGPTAPMIGSLILTYDKLPGQDDNYCIVKITGGTSGNISTYRYNDINELDMIPLNVGDIVEYYTVGVGGKLLTFSRRDYTTDDIDGDMGIRDVLLTAFATGSNSETVYVYRFIVSKDPLDYNFEYRINQANYEVLLEVEYNYNSTVDVDRFVQLYVHREGRYITDYLTSNESLGGFSGTTTGYFPTTLAEMSGFTSLQMVRNICENPHEEKSTQRDSSVYLNNVQIGTGITSNIDYIVLDCPDGFLTNYGDTLTDSTTIPLYGTVKFVMNEEFVEKPTDIVKVAWNYTYTGATNIHTNYLYLDVSAFWPVSAPTDSHIYPRIWLEQNYLTTGDFGSISGITYIDATGNDATSDYWIGFGNYVSSTLTDDESRVRADTTWGINGTPICTDIFPPYDPTWCYGIDWNILYQSPIDPITHPSWYIPVESKPASPGYAMNYEDTWNVYILDQFCNQDIATLDYDLEWNYTSDANTGFTIQNVFISYSGSTPACGDPDNIGLLPQMISSGSTVTGLSGMISGTGTTTTSGIVGATLNYSIGMKLCYDDSVDPLTYRVDSGSTINMYVNNVLYDTTTWSVYPYVYEQPATSRGIAACPTVPAGYAYANFMGVTGLQDGDDIKFEIVDELSPSYYNLEVEYAWSNSQANFRTITGATNTHFDDYVVQSLSGTSGNTSLIVSQENLYNVVGAPNTYRDFASYMCNSGATDVYISRTISMYKNNVLQTNTNINYPVNPYTFTPSSVPIPICGGSNRKYIATEYIPIPTGLTYNDDVKMVVSDIFQIPPTPTPTPTATPTATPTPTPTPIVAPTLFMFYNWSGARTTSKTFDFQYSFDGGTTYTTFYSFSATGSTGTRTSTPITLDASVVGSKSVRFRVNACRATGSLSSSRDFYSQALQLFDGSVYNNVATASSLTDQALPICPTTVTATANDGTVSIVSGGQYRCSWSDTFKDT